MCKGLRTKCETNNLYYIMGIFKTSKMLYGNPALIPTIALEIEGKFRYDGYEVCIENTSDGGKEISITKGGLFKRCLGMRTALKVCLTPCEGNIRFKTDVGLFGNQVIPTVLVLSGWWIILVPQIWGLVRQSKLDDKALEIAERTVYASTK